MPKSDLSGDDNPEKEKLENGLWYDANNDAQLLKLREDADELCFQLNQTSPKDGQKKKTLIEI